MTNPSAQFKNDVQIIDGAFLDISGNGGIKISGTGGIDVSGNVAIDGSLNLGIINDLESFVQTVSDDLYSLP